MQREDLGKGDVVRYQGVWWVVDAVLWIEESGRVGANAYSRGQWRTAGFFLYRLVNFAGTVLVDERDLQREEQR